MRRPIYSRRGLVDPVTLTVLAIIAVVVAVKAPSSVPGRDHWWQFWSKNPITEVQKSQAAVDKAKADEAARAAAAQAKVAAENKVQLTTAHEGSVATVGAIEAAQAVTAAGQLPKKELETAHTTAVLTKDSLDAATGEVVAPARVRELETMVSNLNAGIAAGNTALKSLQTTLDASAEREKALIAKNATDAAVAEAKIHALDDKNRATTEKAETWALQRDAVAKKFENFKFFGALGIGALVLLWLGSIILPIIAKFFPGFAPIAKTVGAVWAPGVQAVQNSATSLNHDFVAMTEWLKTELAAKSTPEEVARIKKTMSDDWMKVSDGTARTVEQIKKKLRLA